MRIYLPSTLSALAVVLADGEVRGAPLIAYAVTDTLRRRHDGHDDEELEYMAMGAAADASLRLLAADPTAPRRRVVIAAEVPDGVLRPTASDGPAGVEVDGGVPLKRVVSAHVDDAEAAEDIAAALAEPEAGHADEHELMWYATQELRYLVG
ncbi:DUF6912 family protein [Marinactinospora thermotolerans]|uniref:Uncharacterized protein n=1 Tax=Marinactinospora thermotolerans DSM 45154 TaxID=1122192 RepID=A0A1T4QIR4_9ACTN|nr:hypothetical protein [Marinactinospora thermotolerans]SKA03527.1 hypothetical protein SAMN02745673_02253 [Marinactinospora thermotolerans DSM 45154]